MADEGTCLYHGLGIWEGDEFWPCQGEQSRIILQDLLCVLWWECGSVMYKVLFDLLSDNVCQDEATRCEPRRARARLYPSPTEPQCPQ